MQTIDIARMVIALTMLILAAHVGGYVFARFRQPPVIGEILGGLLLGPTVLGFFAPAVGAALVPRTGAPGVVLTATSELGLLLLMYLAGGEIRGQLRPGERRTVTAVALSGLAIPVGIGFAAANLFDHSTLSGPHGWSLTFGLVFAIAVGVTSIPVISRIMLDLGILGTPFARKVLSVAVVEDVVLYVALAVVLGLVQGSQDNTYGVLAVLDPRATVLRAVAYIVASVVFFGVFLTRGGQIFAWLARLRINVLQRRDPAAFRVGFLFIMVLLCIVVGIDPIFGALMAGVSVARGDRLIEAGDLGDEGDGDAGATRPGRLASDAIRRFSLAFFIPIYFAIVGLKLDLVHHLKLPFMVGFFLIACAAKGLSVWLGARLAGENRVASINLAVALNARGGPGIVLATVTFAAGVINEDFYTALVLLSIITSQIAGMWLDRTVSTAMADKPGIPNEYPTRQHSTQDHIGRR